MMRMKVVLVAILVTLTLATVSSGSKLMYVYSECCCFLVMVFSTTIASRLPMFSLVRNYVQHSI